MADQTERSVTETAEATPAGNKPAVETVSAQKPAAPQAAKRAEAPAGNAKPAKKTVRKPAARAKPVRTKRAASTRTKPAARPVARSKPARSGAQRQIEGVNQMNKQTRKAVDSGLFAADQFQNAFGDVNARAKVAADRSAKMAEELADLTRGNVEAFVTSSRIAAKGVESLSQEAAEYGRKAFEEASATLRNFAEVKSATDLFRLQGDFARAAFDNAVAESARMSETVLKLAGEVAEPITNRYTAAAERVKTLAA